jgi:hypothetical protein
MAGRSRVRGRKACLVAYIRKNIRMTKIYSIPKTCSYSDKCDRGRCAERTAQGVVACDGFPALAAALAPFVLFHEAEWKGRKMLTKNVDRR